MTEDEYETAWSEPLPIDWNEWRELWAAWLEHNRYRMARAHGGVAFPGKNFMADERLGVWQITKAGAPRVVELSEVTFRNLSARDEDGRLLDTTNRYVGVTYWTPERGRWTPENGLAATFEDLERELFG